MIPLNIFFVFLNESSYKCPASSNPAVCIIDPHISVCERAPGEGRLARGPRGVRRRGQRPPGAGEGRGRPPGPRGRQRRGAPAGHGASSCSAAAASSQAASAGRLLGLCQHCPAVPARRSAREVLHTHARTRPQPARSLRGTRLGTRRARSGAGRQPD